MWVYICTYTENVRAQSCMHACMCIYTYTGYMDRPPPIINCYSERSMHSESTSIGGHHNENDRYYKDQRVSLFKTVKTYCVFHACILISRQSLIRSSYIHLSHHVSHAVWSLWVVNLSSLGSFYIHRPSIIPSLTPHPPSFMRLHRWVNADMHNTSIITQIPTIHPC